MKAAERRRRAAVRMVLTLVVSGVMLGLWVAGAAAMPDVRGFVAGGYPDVTLPAPASGTAAVQVLGAALPAVARAYGLTSAELSAQFLSDRHLTVDQKGRLFYRDEFVGAEGVAGAESGAIAGPALALAPLAETFALHSFPGAQRVIFLDFDGGVLSATAWNDANNGGADIACSPFDFEGGTDVFTDAERTRIQYVWQRVAEDYAPFAVDVTTEDPGVAAITRSTASDEYYGMRVLISPISSYVGPYGGVAYVGVFNRVGDYYKPALVFPENLSQSEKAIGEACAHEAGHTLGLSHDGTTTGTTYYAGHGSGATGWAPIMGNSYYQNLTQWSRGEYAAANNTQDDLVVITNYGLSYRADDHGDISPAATVLTGSGQLTAGGLIGRTGDVDLFSVTSGAGTLTVSAAPSERGPNLDIQLELRDATGSVVAFGNPADLLTANLSVTVPQGTYHIAVRGTGKGDPLATGYTDYASLGWYTLSATVPSASGNLPPVAAMSASPEVGDAPLPVVFDGSGSYDTDGTVVSYSWDFGDGSTGAGATASHTYATPGSYTATLTVTDSAGAPDETTQLITVQAPAANQPPVAAMTATPASGVAPVTVSLNGGGSSDPDGSVVSYSWSFGDGSTGTGATASHTYTAAGNYLVTLVVTDDDGATDDTTQFISVQAPNVPPTAVVTATPASGSAPVIVTLGSAGSSDPDGSIASYAWTFGDGYAGVGATANHTYSSPGTYTATLTVTDDRGATATAAVTISVSQDQTRVLRVASVQVTVVSVKGGVQAQAIVKVVDGIGAAVPTATVTGQFLGAVTGTGTGTTNTSGIATILSRKYKKGTPTFQVTSVAKADYTYQTGAEPAYATAVETADALTYDYAAGPPQLQVR